MKNQTIRKEVPDQPDKDRAEPGAAPFGDQPEGLYQPGV